jgi:hypothetical protein
MLSLTNKAIILSKQFFPTTADADLTDIGDNVQAAYKLPITQTVTQEELEMVTQRFPNGKTPGPDEIPNEILKTVAPLVSKDLAGAVTQCFAMDCCRSSRRNQQWSPYQGFTAQLH